MVGCPSLPQETINLVNENNSRLELVSETKYSSHCHSNNIPTSVYSIHTQKKNTIGINSKLVNMWTAKLAMQINTMQPPRQQQ